MGVSDVGSSEKQTYNLADKSPAEIRDLYSLYESIMFGLLNLDKPAGLTSRDAVNRVQRLVRPHKVGHAGTLDPLATGVLVVAIGQATRLVEYVQRMPKTYQATFLLGRTSDTEDIEGNVVELPDRPCQTKSKSRQSSRDFSA